MFAGARIARASPLDLIAPHPGASLIERLVTAAETLAEHQVANPLTRGLLPAQAKALDALLATKEGASLSVLAWARQPPGGSRNGRAKSAGSEPVELSGVSLLASCKPLG